MYIYIYSDIYQWININNNIFIIYRWGLQINLSPACCSSLIYKSISKSMNIYLFFRINWLIKEATPTSATRINIQWGVPVRSSKKSIPCLLLITYIQINISINEYLFIYWYFIRRTGEILKEIHSLFAAHHWVRVELAHQARGLLVSRQRFVLQKTHLQRQQSKEQQQKLHE